MQIQYIFNSDEYDMNLNNNSFIDYNKQKSSINKISNQQRRNQDFNKETVNKSQEKLQQGQFIEDIDSKSKNLKDTLNMQNQFVYQHPNPYHSNHLQQLSLQFAPTQQQQLNNNGVLMQSSQTQQEQKQQLNFQQMQVQKNQQTSKEIEEQMTKNMSGNQKQEAIVLVAKRIPINQSASETNLRGKALRQSVGNRNQENKLDVIMQGSNNFSSDRWNYAKGQTQNKKVQQALDLSPKNQISINQNQLQFAPNQLYALQNTNQLSGQDDLNTQTTKLNQKREAISQQYFMTSSSSNSLSYSFFPTKSHLISNNSKGSQKQIVKGQIPSLSIIPQQQKLEYQTNCHTSQLSDQQKKGELFNKLSRKSGNNFHTDNIKNLFLKNNEQTQQNFNNLSGNNCSGTIQIPQSASQERRVIKSSQGQKNFGYKQAIQTDELPLLKEFSNKQNRNIVNDKIEQFLASDYKAQQKNLEILLSSQEQHTHTQGNEISNTEGICKSFPDNDQDEDNNLRSQQKKQKKNLVFTGKVSNKPLSERQYEDYQNINNLNINKLNVGSLQSQSSKNYQQNPEQNPVKLIQQFQFKNGSKYEQTIAQNTPFSAKNTNMANGNSSNRNQYQIQQDIQNTQSNSKNNLNQPTRFQNTPNPNNLGNLQNIPDMIILGSQAIEPQKPNKIGLYSDQYKNQNNIYYNASKQEQSAALSNKGDESSKDNLSSFKENPHSSSSTQLPSLNAYGGSQSMKSSTNKSSQKEDQSQQQYLIEAILAGNRQRSKISPSSSHLQRRSQVGEQQVSRKRNQQKPSYLLSDESELSMQQNQVLQSFGTQYQGTNSNLLVNNDFQNSQTLSPSQQKQGIEFQMINDQYDNINSEPTPQSINAYNISQQTNQISNQDVNQIELAIYNQSSQDQQKRQLLRLNPYKIRYLELQQKKMLMQMAQPDQIQQLDLKGFQILQNQYTGGVLTNLQSLASTNQQQQYRYYVGYGNNAELIKRLLKSRDWWCEYNSETQQGGFNFRWTQGIQGIKYDKLNSNAVKQCVNHFEEHREISQKDLLVKNLKLFCETNKIFLFSITPCTFLIDLNDDACELQITKFANFFCKYHPNKNDIGENSKKAISEFKKNIKPIYTTVNANYKKIKSNIYSKPIMYPSFIYNSNKQNDGNYIWLLKTTIYNRGRGIELFSSFEQLEKQMIKYTDGAFDRNLYLAEEYYQNQNDILNKQQSPTSKDQENNNNPQDTLPTIIQQTSLSTQLSNQISQINFSNTETSSIVSPTNILNNQNTQANQNNNIHLNQQAQTQPNQQSTKNKEKEQKQVKNWQILKSQTFVFQKYIEKPMLINGRKFDMRMFVLVTHNMDCHFYKCGYIRTASEMYRMDDLDNQFIHLTNNAVQKYAKNYGEFEDGNILSLEQFDELIKRKGTYEGLNLYGKIIPQIREICLMTLASVKKKLNSQERKYCFELFGYDFFIDEDYRVWLIEVNTNPSIEESNEYLHQFMPRLLDDTFKLTIDKIFPPPPINGSNSQSKNNQPFQNNPIQSSPNGNQQNKFTFQKRNSSLQVQQTNQKQSTENSQQDIYSQFAINNNNSSGYLPKDEQTHQNLPSPSQDKNDYKNSLSEQNNYIQNVNLNIIKEEDNSMIFGDKIDTGINNTQNEQVKQNQRKREKFPLVGHSDDENLWQFMANLSKFNFSVYSQQTLSNLSPQTYHPLRDILTQSNKLVNIKSNSKKNQ